MKTKKSFVKEWLHKFGGISLACLLFVFSCWYIVFQHYPHFGRKQDVISTIETKILDLKFKLRGVQKPKSNIGILAIDEKTLQSFGSWPFSRGYYGKALQNLQKYGVRLIGFDAVFAETEKANIQDLHPQLQKLHSPHAKERKQAWKDIQKFEKTAPGDLLLIKGLHDFHHVVLGYFYFEHEEEVKNGGRSLQPFAGLEGMQSSEISAVILPENQTLAQSPAFLQAKGLVANTPDITQPDVQYGFFSNAPDADAIVRWVTQVKIIDNKVMPSLSLKMAAEMLDAEILVTFDRFGVEALELVRRQDESKSLKIPLDPFGEGRVLANHHGPSMTFRHYSLADAYHDTFTPEEKKALKGSALLVGMTAIGINDQRPNPFDATLDGVENHASALDNILNQTFMQRPKSIYSLELLIILLIGLLFAPIIIFTRAVVSGLLMLLFLIGYGYFDWYFVFQKGIWAYMGMPIFEIISLFTGITLYKYTTEEREKKKIRGAFSHYLSPEVIQQVLEQPDMLQLGGEKKELTIFFSDVRGFTTISEGLSPEQLCEFMNDYFTVMTKIVLKSGGVLDKYIGDAMMAFWGAPLSIPNQADVAADAAIEMLGALEQLQQVFAAKGFPPCEIGIGLNTGSMSVGNMGSEERFCYTVMGDAVNLGSRLENLTKEYGVQILASEFTVQRLEKPHHLVRELDDIRVKGKNEPVKIYQLLRPDMLPNRSAILALVDIFSEGRILYREQKWSEARNKFQQCLTIFPEDGPSLMYLERIEKYSALEVIEGWDGVFTFTHK